jgi:RHS repeat-associated protein
VYSPPLGRFLSTDPLEANPTILYDNNWFGDALTRMRNLYGYTGNNPINFVDPSGLEAESCDIMLGACPKGCVKVTGKPSCVPTAPPWTLKNIDKCYGGSPGCNPGNPNNCQEACTDCFGDHNGLCALEPLAQQAACQTQARTSLRNCFALCNLKK